MKEIHSLLRRQFKRYQIDPACLDRPEYLSFLEEVNESYFQFDSDRRLLERSLELSSQELLQSNSEMRAIFQAMPDLFIRLNADGMILDCKGGFKTDFQIDPRALIGQKIQKFPSLYVARQFRDALLEVKKTRAPVSIVYSLDGDNPLSFEARFVPHFENQTIVIIRSIPERKQIERDLENSLSLLKATLESTADGILVVNLKGKIISCNQKFFEVWKIPASIISQGEDVQTLSYLHNQVKDPDAYINRMQELYSLPDFESHDILELKDGRVIERYSKPQRLGGKSVGRVWSFQDITERTRLDRLKDEFLSTVSHEIRTPLTIVRQSISNLGDGIYGSITQLQMNGLDVAARNVERLSRIINDILDFSRLESGKARVQSQQLNMRLLIEEVIESFKDKAAQRRVLVESDFPDDLADIPADPDMILQLLYNLLDNAIRFAKTKVCVSIEANKDQMQVSVLDDGIGISPKYAAKLFGKFEQINRPVGGGGYKGTGLGLSISKRIVELHGGQIWVESEPGERTAFNFTLPFKREGSESMAPAVQKVDVSLTSRLKRKILIVDDEKDLVELIISRLTFMGMLLDVALDGMTGLEKLRTFRPDIVLLDLVMPGMDGWEFCRKMRMNSFTKDIQVIIFTALPPSECEAEARSLDVNQIIYKPFEIEDLIGMLNSSK